MGRVLSFPINGQHPPTGAVIHQLKAVDAAGKWLFSLGVARFIGAEHVGNVVPNFYSVGHSIFKKTILAKKGLAAHGILVRRKGLGAHNALVIAAAGNQACARIEKAAETVPIARTSRA